jgi:hypothetical protein
MPYNNHIHSDSKKRRSFVALLFAAGDVKRSKDAPGTRAAARNAFCPSDCFNVARTPLR